MTDLAMDGLMRELTSEELALVAGGWNPLPAIGHAVADVVKDAIDTGKNSGRGDRRSV